MASTSLQRIALAAGSVALVAAGAEITARASYDAPWYEQLAAEQRRSEHFDYRLGPLLIRDQLPSGPKVREQRRVMVIGDSFTFGLGVRDDEAIFPRVMETQLNETLPIPGVTRFEVLNAGRPGSLTHNWIQLWDGLHEAFSPDLLLVVFFLRDGTNLLSNPRFFDRIREEVVARNRSSKLYANSYLYRWIRDGLDRRSLGDEYTREFLDAYSGSDEETAEWRAAQRNLVALRDRAHARGAGFALALFPVLAALGDDYPFQEICDLLEDFAIGQDMPVHSLLPAFRGRSGPELWVSPFDQHPNEAAHAIAAESLLPFVIELLREPSNAKP